MGYVKPRITKRGVKRYAAIYWDHDGKEKSAGTFSTHRRAERAWKAAEGKVADGQGRQLVKGRQRFRDYVEKCYLPNHQLELSTFQSYVYLLERYIMDYYADLRMNDIHSDVIRSWIKMLKAAGATGANLDKVVTVLSAILTSAVNDEVLVSNPCHRVRREQVEAPDLVIVSPEEFEVFYEALPDDQSKLMVEVAISTGLRWGELTELRPSDIDMGTGMLTVSRAVVTVAKRFHPDGERFLVKEYPKERRRRKLKLDDPVLDRIGKWIQENRLGPTDLLFAHQPQRSRKRQTEEPKLQGHTEPNEKGRTYPHGSMSGYNLGNCRCQLCRDAIADYRANRRKSGMDRAPRALDEPQLRRHIPGGYFRQRIIKHALKSAAIRTDIRMHLLRHAHASWLVNGGADLQTAKARLGHAKITTTERYLHTLDNADDTALAAYRKVRHRSTGGPLPNSGKQHASTTQELLNELARIQEALSRAMSG